jgi:hypothetical protein
LILGDEFYRGVDQFKDVLGDIPILGGRLMARSTWGQGSSAAFITRPRSSCGYQREGC